MATGRHPAALDAIHRAIELNGVAIDRNKQAFDLGLWLSPIRNRPGPWREPMHRCRSTPIANKPRNRSWPGGLRN